MTNSGSVPRPVAFSARIQPLIRFTGCLGLVTALLANVAATSPSSESPEEQYIHIMAIIDRADALRKSGNLDAAHGKYIEAEKALMAFKSANPLFFPKTVVYRLKEVTERADERAAVPAQTNSAAKPSANLEAEPAKSNVKLIDAGVEPRSVLRYHVKAGDKQIAILTTKVKLDLPTPPTGQAAEPTPSIPAVSIPMEITVQNVAANGDITYQSVMGEATLVQSTNTTPEVAQVMQPVLAGIKGTTGTTTISSRGVTKKMDIKAPANPQARQYVDQIKQATTSFSVELPEEAVGSGAKWGVKEQTKVQATTVEESGTYELAGLEGDKLMIKFSGGVESGGKAAASGVNGSVSGTMTVDLSKAVAGSAQINVHQEVPVGRDKSQLVKMDVSIGLEAQ